MIALVAYLIAAPWLMLALPLYLNFRRKYKLIAGGPTEYELELSDAILHVRCGNLSSSVLPGGMKAVERLGSHLALTLENLAVFLIPLTACSSEEEIDRWLSGLRSLIKSARPCSPAAAARSASAAGGDIHPSSSD